jgi:uncharacterized protein YqeY
LRITDQVQSDLVAAMKARDKERVSALRMILSQLQLAEKEARGDFGEEQELRVLATEKKKRLQASEAFLAGGREESAAREDAEAAIIESYLPLAMGEAELSVLVDEAIAATGAGGLQDMGRVMSQVMPRVAGRADGKAVSDMVKKRLQGLS